MAKLTDSIIKSAKPTEARYQLADGNGLVLYIMPNGAKLWRYRYRYNGTCCFSLKTDPFRG